MKVCRHAHPQSFLERAGAFLLRSEVENGLILGIARQLLEDDSRYDKPIYLATLEDNDTVLGCAFRTPPYQLGLSAMPAPAIALLAADIEEIYPALPAVSGPVPVARQFADAWTAQTGGRWSVRFQLRIHVLEQSVVSPIRPYPEHCAERIQRTSLWPTNGLLILSAMPASRSKPDRPGNA
jgi:hypothetical protein